MGNNYNVTIKKYNGTDYDNLYPTTLINNVTNLQTQLDSKATTTTYTTTIEPTWTGTQAPYTQTIAITGILYTDNPIVDIVPSSNYDTAVEQLDQYPLISYITTANGYITVTCLGTPTTINIPVQLLCVR